MQIGLVALTLLEIPFPGVGTGDVLLVGLVLVVAFPGPESGVVLLVRLIVVELLLEVGAGTGVLLAVGFSPVIQ